MKTAKKTMTDKYFSPFNKKISLKIGVEAAALLGLIAEKQEYYNEQPFYLTQKSVEEEIGMTKKVYLKCKKILSEEGLVTTWLHDNSTPYFFIDEKCIINIQNIIQGCSKKEQGVFQNVIGGVLKGNTEVFQKGSGGVPKSEGEVFQKGTGGVPKGNTNNNLYKELNNNKNKELINNELKLEINNTEIGDIIDYKLKYGLKSI